jgi:lysophospholipase L1-like esterase
MNPAPLGRAMRSVAAIAAIAALVNGGAAAAGDRGSWLGTWQSSPAALPTAARAGPATLPEPVLAQGTVRYRLRISQGGTHIRLRLSNELGLSLLELTSATVGLAAADGLDVAAGSFKDVTFAGRRSVSIPAGAPALSDSIDFPVKSLADVVVSIYVAAGTTVFACKTDHSPADEGMVRGGDATRTERAPGYACVYTIRPLVSAIDVLAARARPVVVAFGDSITDGRPLPESGDRGWPGVLSRRLQTAGISVVNAGIGGNRLLASLPVYGEAALSRFDRDVLAVPGATHIVVLEGINDIGMSGPGGLFGDTPPVGEQELISAYAQIIARAHERGIKVIGATMLPFEGSLYFTAERERVRAAANRWILTPGNFDACIDFASQLQDPENSQRLNARYDSGDHLHPSAAGYRRMGDAIDTALFRR